MHQGYTPQDGDVLVRIESDYYYAYKRLGGQWKRICLGPVDDPASTLAWTHDRNLTCMKSTLGVFQNVLCGFYRPVEQEKGA